MSFSDLRPAARRLLLLTWAAGALSLFAITIRFLVNDTPYPAPWAWLSFLGMMVIEDLVSGSGEDARWAALPRLTLFAAIIVFRRHPEITMLLALAAGPLAVVGLLGVFIGFIFGGELSRFEANVRRLANWRAVAVASLMGLVIVFAMPGLAFVPGIVVVVAMGGWAVHKRVPGAICGALGGLSNVAAVTFNGGRMPVVVPGPDRAGDFTDSSHTALTAATRLSWLADRFPMPVFPGVASPGDALVMLGMVWLIVDMMLRRPRTGDAAEELSPVAA